MVNHRMLNVFVEIWHTKTSSFHLPLGEMFITLDDVSCLFHIPINEKLIDHGRITRDEALEMMVDYLGVDPEDAMSEFENTIRAHARFEFLKKVYTYDILIADKAIGDDEQEGLYRTYAMRAYLLFNWNCGFYGR
ncbi:protein MAIN-LIKE 1-like [Lathyrus oleraceus]|uniref:protein MAIN-LIKE 1-like n=1 Tax=Pisum sativum TaxID=3888 RepID=UPI0021D0F725|nr:protein MAIN-LIKE 1-like [Pisum sativum]